MINFDIPSKDNNNNSKLLPNSIRACIIGGSGCGKTNLMFNLLLNKYDNEDYLAYDKLLIFSMSLHQEKYQILGEAFKEGVPKAKICKYFQTQDFKKNIEYEEEHGIEYEATDNVDKVPDPKTVKAQRTVMVFDDLITTPQSKIFDYYTRGRHNNIDCFYLSQSYKKLDKNYIRMNANFFIFFKLNYLDMECFYNERCRDDMDLKDFMYICNSAWKEKHGFVTISFDHDFNYGRYRKNLNIYAYELG